MSTFIERIKAWFSKSPSPKQPPPAPGAPVLDDAAVRNLMTALSMTRDDELSCGEVYALLDEYADHVVNDEDAAALMPLVEHHLMMCKDCCDQYDVLLHLLEADEADLT